jgi:serine/tyrosine/threonine adenylyltransferase
MSIRFPFDNTYARLPERFYARVTPAPVRAPMLVQLNRALAAHLGLDPDALEGPDGAAVLSGNRVPEGAEPLAAAYAGHQFGVFVPQLGDGRAILLGEVVDRDGVRRDIQLKGAGRTPFSRGGDGRAAVGPVLREYLVSEAMAALGIPTTRALAAVVTGDTVIREERLPGAVLTRVASSHIRVGTFEYFATRGDVEAVRLLADHALGRHYPDAAGAERPYRAFLDAVIDAQARLIAQWLLVGFIHGVMNTDNMSVAGETIDYGPCAFMDGYDPRTVFSSIDHAGRYAWHNQPSIGGWNLARLAECLLPLLADDAAAALEDAQAALAAYGPRVTEAYEAGLLRKIGIAAAREGDIAIARDLLDAMAVQGADFTLTFRRLADAAFAPEQNPSRPQSQDHEIGVGRGFLNGEAELRRLFKDPTALDEWLPRWRTRLEQETGGRTACAETMRRVNPAFIPRNHRVEAVIRAAVDAGDFGPFAELLEIVTKPFDDQPAFAAYADPPQDDERVVCTFCGT